MLRAINIARDSFMPPSPDPHEIGEAGSWVWAMLLFAAMAGLGFGAGWFASP